VNCLESRVAALGICSSNKKPNYDTDCLREPRECKIIFQKSLWKLMNVLCSSCWPFLSVSDLGIDLRSNSNPNDINVNAVGGSN